MGINIKKDATKEDIGRYSEKQHEIANQGWLFYDAPYKCARHIAKRLTGVNIIDLGGGDGIMAGVIEAVNGEFEINVYEGNLQKTGYKDNEFDTVYTSHVLEHVSNPLAIVKESIRIAKYRVIHVVPQGYTEDINVGTKHISVFNRNNFMSLMGQAIEDCKDDIGIADFDIILDTHCNSLICVLLKG